jgi:hypothetical protein
MAVEVVVDQMSKYLPMKMSEAERRKKAELMRYEKAAQTVENFAEP